MKSLYPSGFDDVKGEGRDQKNLDFWAARASRNSRIAPRAKSTITLPDNGGKPKLHSTSDEPPIDMTVEAALTGAGNFSDEIMDD